VHRLVECAEECRPAAAVGGVPADDREAVFTPFFTTKEEGTGLGLAIAREFTVAHAGRLSLDDGDGRGATSVLPLRRG
jgi:signal transduction histidine kinase